MEEKSSNMHRPVQKSQQPEKQISHSESTFIDNPLSKQLEMPLVESKDMYRMLFDNMSLGHDCYRVIYDENKKVVDCIIEEVNAECERLTGCNRADVIGKRMLEVYPEMLDSIAIWSELFAEISLTGNNKTFELYSNARKRWYKVYYYCPAPGFIASIFSDITDQKQALIYLEKQKQEAEEASHHKGEYIANMSHELRTPLNVMLAITQLFPLYEQGDLNVHKPKIMKNIQIMKQNCLRMVRLVNNLIDSTKIDAGNYELVFEENDLEKIVFDIVRSVKSYIESKGIQLEFCSSIRTRVILCDADAVERIILNLISNAIKYTNDLIRIQIEENEEYLLISVIDNGLGLAKDTHAEVFKRYKQINNLLTREHEGSGIGLSLVKSLVEMHGGKITLKSEFGSGCEFTVELPVRKLKDIHVDRERYKTNKVSIAEKMVVEFADIYK